MAYTYDDLANLQKALASGEKIVRFGDRWIEFRSVEELKQAIAEVKADLRTNEGTRRRQIRIFTESGF
jgi:hypothetical protein